MRHAFVPRDPAVPRGACGVCGAARYYCELWAARERMDARMRNRLAAMLHRFASWLSGGSDVR